MTDINEHLDSVLAEVQEVFLDRHEKYGPLNITNSPGGPLNGLRVRIHDKVARINNYVDNGGTQDFVDDAFRDAFVDIVGYGLIGLMVVDGLWPGTEPGARAVDFSSLYELQPGDTVKVGLVKAAEHPELVDSDGDHFRWENGEYVVYFSGGNPAGYHDNHFESADEIEGAYGLNNSEYWIRPMDDVEGVKGDDS